MAKKKTKEEPFELSPHPPKTKGRKKEEPEEEVIDKTAPPLASGPTMRNRLTPFVFQVYPVFRIAVKNVEVETLVEGEEYDMILAPILFDVEVDSVRRIAIYSNESRNHLNRGFYRTASTRAELFQGLQILHPTKTGPNGTGVVIDQEASLAKWLAGLKEMWDKRESVYKEALLKSQKS